MKRLSYGPLSHLKLIRALFQIVLEFRHVSFWDEEGKITTSLEKPLGLEKRTKINLNPHMTSTLASAVSLLHPCSPKFSLKTCWELLLGLFVIRPWFRRLWTRLNYVTARSGNDELYEPFSLTPMSRKCSVFNFCDDDHGGFSCWPKKCAVYVLLTTVFNQRLKSRYFQWFGCF